MANTTNNSSQIYAYLLQYAAHNIGHKQQNINCNSPNYLYLPSSQGSGYVVVHKLSNELTLSIININLACAMRTSQQHNLDSLLSVSFIIHGGIEVRAASQAVRLINNCGEIWTQTGSTALTASNIPIGVQQSLRIDIHSKRLSELVRLDNKPVAEFAGYKIDKLDSHLKNLCSQIIDYYNKTELSSRDFLCIESLLFNLLANWQFSAQLSHANLPTNKHRHAVAQALKIISKKLAQPLSIAYLASQVGINECYLKSAFKQLTGFSIGAYIRQQRLALAQQLLLNSELSIAQIANKVGYANSSHFSRAFCRQYQLNPLQMRRLAAANNYIA